MYTRGRHAQNASRRKHFIRTLRPRWPAIEFRIYEITGDRNARARWQELCRATGKLPGLPTFDFAGQVIVGYQGDSITGQALAELIERASRNGAVDRSTKPKAQDQSSSRTLWPDPTIGMMLPAFVSSGLFAQLDQATADANVEFDEIPLPEGFDLPDADEEDQSADEESIEPVSEVIEVPLLGELRPGEIGFPLFTFFWWG